MDASTELHLQEIHRLSNIREGGFTPIGDIVSHLIAVVRTQEHRISALEQELVKVGHTKIAK